MASATYLLVTEIRLTEFSRALAAVTRLAAGSVEEGTHFAKNFRDRRGRIHREHAG
jgi:hypothetical protein